MFQVIAKAARPDFRVIIDLLFEPGREIDTSGNCRYPKDIEWTDLYVKDRESDRPPVNIWIPEQYWDDDDNCLQFVFYIESADVIAEEAVAIYLFDYCGESILENQRALNADERRTLRERYADLISRANRSVHYAPSEQDA
mgnify:CR=1 FL=1